MRPLNRQHLQILKGTMIIWWMDDLRFYVLFNSISVISGRWKDYDKRLCAMETCFTVEKISHRAELEPGTVRSLPGLLFGKELFIRFLVRVFRGHLSNFECVLLSLLVLRVECGM